MKKEEAFAKLHEYQVQQAIKWTFPEINRQKLIEANLRIAARLQELGLPLSDYVSYTLLTPFFNP